MMGIFSERKINLRLRSVSEARAISVRSTVLNPLLRILTAAFSSLSINAWGDSPSTLADSNSYLSKQGESSAEPSSVNQESSSF